MNLVFKKWGRISSTLYNEGTISVANGLSTAIDDACNAFNDLKERHALMDTFCIVQDDLEDKARHVGQMDLMYGAALFTTVFALMPISCGDSGCLTIVPSCQRITRKFTELLSKKSKSRCRNHISKITSLSRAERQEAAPSRSPTSRADRYILPTISTVSNLYAACGAKILVGEGHFLEANIKHSTTL